jgi:putative CocE/NonD family hydrolase
MRHLVTILLLVIAAPAVVVGEDVRFETLMVPSEGDIELAVDVYHPQKEPAPVVLVRTPYGRQGLAFVGEAFAAAGYAVAVQDVRGRYGSTGEHRPFRHEHIDGLATIHWLKQQAWCDGRIGMWGSSYGGYAALILADAEVDGFQSIFSISGWTVVDEITRPGGAMHLLLDLPWMLTQQGRQQRSLREFDVDSLFRHAPLRDALRAAGIRNDDWEDPSWMDQVGRARELGAVRRPVMHVTGWHDMVYRATLDAWKRLTRKATAPQKLVIGPWYHNQFLFEAWEVGDAHFGPASGFGTDEVIALSLRWFDATLKDERNGILQEPPVSFFLMGQNSWQEEEAWPPAAPVVTLQRWYLDSGGHANGLDGDGVISTTKPTGAPHDRFLFDPHDPVPTRGGAQFFYFPDLLGVRDQREIEKREDVLVYTSAPLVETMQLTGRVSATLRVASSARSTDFTAKLVLVRPNGYARIVEEGIKRVVHGSSGSHYVVTIDLGHTAVEVPRDHRLRIEISSSNFPKYDRNPNTGVDPFVATQFESARQTIFHSQDRLSYVTLPARARTLVATPAALEPLIRPAVEAAAAAEPVAGDDAAALLAQGRRELDEGEHDQAIATLERSVELSPDQSEMHHQLGRAYLDKLQNSSIFKKLGLSKKVRKSYRRAIELDPDNLEARESLAQFYFNAPGVAGGSFDKGLEQVGEIESRDAHAAHRLMAGVYRDRDEPEKAKERYRAAIALDPNDADAHYGLGVVHQGEKEWGEAVEALEASLRAATEERALYRALYQLGRTGALSGESLPRAKEAMEKYIAAEPDIEGLPSAAAAHWRLGMIYEHMQRPDLARREYETALELQPGMEQAREALESL